VSAGAITTQEVSRAAAELQRMRGSLASWLKYRAMNDQILAGTARVKKPLAYAQAAIMRGRDLQIEQDLATKLSALLSAVMPGGPLPSPSLQEDPQAAVKLATIALHGGSSVSSPTATGGLLTGGPPWLWPVLIVGGVLLAVTTAVKTAADVAKDREEKACIIAGGCTDYGFWLRAGGLVAIAWFAWREMGLRNVLTKKGGS
jgi:hypothetical protein